MKAQPEILKGLVSKLWCRFFLLSVFVTMYLNDLQRKDFYAAIGLDAREYDLHVIHKTNESAGRVFPVILDTENPKFIALLDSAAAASAKLAKAGESDQPGFVKALRQIPHVASIGVDLAKMYFMKPIITEVLRGTVR